MQQPHVRPMSREDAVRASEILINAFKGFLGDKFDKTTAEHFSPAMLIRGMAEKNNFETSRIFVADVDGRTVGVVKVTAGVNGLGSFDYVGVDPECHIRGIGALLMRKAEEFWEEHQQRKISTCVSAHNKKALIYYIKNDFIPEGYQKDHFNQGVDEIILGRFLKFTG